MGLRNVRAERTTDEACLRQLFRQHQVRVGLGLRIKRFMKIHYNSRKSRIHEEDINFFRNLPFNLKIELHEEMYSPVITAHPLFYFVSTVDYEATLELCHLAMSQTY